jgi:hypothetical protein
MTVGWGSPSIPFDFIGTFHYPSRSARHALCVQEHQQTVKAGLGQCAGPAFVLAKALADPDES